MSHGNALPPSVYLWLGGLAQRARARGVRLIDLGIGSPDRPTPVPIREELARSYAAPRHQNYPPTRGIPRFLEAASGFMRRRFDLDLDPNSELLCVSGSEEGFTHLALTFLGPEAHALVGDIHYPIHARSARIARSTAHLLPLRAEHGFRPTFDDIPAHALRHARVLIVNYPHNPTGAIAHADFFAEAVDFCRANGLLLISDLAYSEMTFDGHIAPSALQTPDARDVTIELHSLSKSFNMAGSRIAFAAGSATAIAALESFRSNCSYGSPTAIQEGAAFALDHAEALVPDVMRVYAERRSIMVAGLRALGCELTAPPATMFLWLRTPAGFTSASTAEHLIEHAGVVVTPGHAFGPGGEGWLRISLVAETDVLEEALARLGKLALDWSAPRRAIA